MKSIIILGEQNIKFCIIILHSYLCIIYWFCSSKRNCENIYKIITMLKSDSPCNFFSKSVNYSIMSILYRVNMLQILCIKNW